MVEKILTWTYTADTSSEMMAKDFIVGNGGVGEDEPERVDGFFSVDDDKKDKICFRVSNDLCFVPLVTITWLSHVHHYSHDSGIPSDWLKSSHRAGALEDATLPDPQQPVVLLPTSENLHQRYSVPSNDEWDQKHRTSPDDHHFGKMQDQPCHNPAPLSTIVKGLLRLYIHSVRPDLFLKKHRGPRLESCI